MQILKFSVLLMFVTLTAGHLDFLVNFHGRRCILDPSYLRNDEETTEVPSTLCKALCFENYDWTTFDCFEPKVSAGCTLGERKYPVDNYPKCCERYEICTDKRGENAKK
ncbi:uncharacterized protein LOC117784763 [Drosophila innubila]|uniref:uncharacterized protein LOC117784763 n=1 Tax=Drosophila innubila TaxID=198719 RepID=UPI00148E24B8|nr:uncharacterized protein LOC117784763 [Drosophila innubila]